jgi:hypothetical protein
MVQPIVLRRSATRVIWRAMRPNRNPWNGSIEYQ